MNAFGLNWFCRSERTLFSATQIGFQDLNECPHLCTLSYDYLKKTEGYEQNLLAFFHNKMNPDALLVQLIEELDKCILSYFSFHWKFATHIITQVWFICSTLAASARK